MKKKKIVSILYDISFLNFGFIYLAINLSALPAANRDTVCLGEKRGEVTYFHSLSPSNHSRMTVAEIYRGILAETPADNLTKADNALYAIGHTSQAAFVKINL